MATNNTQRKVQAAAWRTHLTEIGADTTPEFETWLTADPQNQTAWQQAQAPWDLFGQHANSPELLKLRRTALGNAHAASRQRWLHGPTSLRNLRGALAAGLGVITLALILLLTIDRTEHYRTAAGERRTITLSDGTKIALDAQTEVRIAYTTTARELTLRRGQARFDVAHDLQRPFSVNAGGQRVIALATAFNVDLLGPNVLVTLIEGRVAVLSGEGHSKPGPRNQSGNAIPVEKSDTKDEIILSPGEQLVASTQAMPTVAPVNIDRATAWEKGQLVFDNEPLSSVIERVNRYAPKHVIIADERAAGLKLSGVFNAGDVDGFVSTITHYLPIQAESQNGGSIQLAYKSPQS